MKTPKGKRGAGARTTAKTPTKRKVSARAKPPKPEPEPEPEPCTDITKLRAMALEELAKHVVGAARAIGQAATNTLGRRPRGAGSQEATQKWLLQTIFDRVSPDDVASGDESPVIGGPSPIDELAARRAALKTLIRSQRKDMNK